MKFISLFEQTVDNLEGFLPETLDSNMECPKVLCNIA